MVFVKICGITNMDDALLAKESGADFMGAITEVPVNTPRKVSREKAREIFHEIQDSPPSVMVIMPLDEMVAFELYSHVKPDYIQLHGKETPEFIKVLRAKVSAKIIKTIHVKDESAINEAKKYSPFVDAILLDTPSKSGGGSGKTHDWEIARAIVEGVHNPVILAGGLNPDNVAEAVGKVRPYAVDVSSGVEWEPGKKDPEKLKLFIQRAKRV